MLYIYLTLGFLQRIQSLAHTSNLGGVNSPLAQALPLRALKAVMDLKTNPVAIPILT